VAVAAAAVARRVALARVVALVRLVGLVRLVPSKGGAVARLVAFGSSAVLGRRRPRVAGQRVRRRHWRRTVRPRGVQQTSARRSQPWMAG
jgi:hypothetical protein